MKLLIVGLGSMGKRRARLTKGIDAAIQIVGDLTLSETPEDARPLGKYGRLRRSYLQEHRPGLYSRLVLSEKLFPHLREIDETANRRLEQMMPELMKAAGVTEELKARDQMKWVGLMNSLKAQAEEIILSELVYN